MVHLFYTCRHLLFATAIDDHRALSTKTLSSTYSIHSGVTTTDDSYVLAIEQRRISSWIGSVHKVNTGQILVGGHHTVEVLTGYVHKARQTGSRTHKNTLEALLLEFFNRDSLTNDRIGMKLYAQRTQAIDLDIYDAVRQTELRNTVFEHTTYLVQRFKDMYLIAELSHITGKRQTGRTGTNDCNLRCIRWICDL